MLDQFEKQLEYCTYCPRLCQSACPVLATEGNEAHAPWGIMQTLNMVRRGEIPFDEEIAALSYQCLTCKACTEQCHHGNEIPPVLHEVRKLAVKHDLAPPEITGFLEKFHRHNNPFSKDLLQKLKKIVPAKYFQKDTPVIYFESCTTIAQCPEVIRDTFELFEKLKIDFVGIYPESIQCCGYPLITGGLEDEFVELAEINFNTFKQYKTIITGSPACVYTLRETYKEYALGLGSRVVSINELLEPYLHNINYQIKKSIRTKIIYHDPCYSCRYLHEVDRPRELIGQVTGIQPVEFNHHGEKTACSGQGGCYSIMNKDVSDQICKVRLEEVYEKNIQTIITQCPSCIHKFRKNSNHLIIKDLVSYLNDCIEGTKD